MFILKAVLIALFYSNALCAMETIAKWVTLGYWQSNNQVQNSDQKVEHDEFEGFTKRELEKTIMPDGKKLSESIPLVVGPSYNFYDINWHPIKKDISAMNYLPQQQILIWDESKKYPEKNLIYSIADVACERPKISWNEKGSIVTVRGKGNSFLSNDIILTNIDNKQTTRFAQKNIMELICHKKNNLFAVHYADPGNYISTKFVTYDEELKTVKEIGTIIGSVGGHCWFNSQWHPTKKIFTYGKKDDRTLALWDVENKKELASIKYEDDAPGWVRWSNDGNHLVVGTLEGNSINVYDEKLQKIRNILYPRDPNSFLCFGNYASKLLSAFSGKIGSVVHTGEPRILGKLEHNFIVRDVQIDPQEELVASIAGNELKIWTKFGKLLKTITKHYSGSEFEKKIKIRWNNDGSKLAVMYQQEDRPVTIFYDRNDLTKLDEKKETKEEFSDFQSGYYLSEQNNN